MDEADRYRLSPEQHERIFRERIVPRLTRGLEGVEHPRAIVLGGQPGAGKSALQSAAERELAARGGVLAIVGDDLRDFHPHYRALLRSNDKTAAFYTDRDSGQWVEKLIAYAKDQRYNLVIEGTMRVPDKVVQTMADLRGAGYYVDARAVAVDARLSTLGIHQRYERMIEVDGYGRFTVAKSHDDAYRGMLSTVERIERERLADRLAIYARGNILRYENTLHAGAWRHEPGARSAIEVERGRPWTPAEKALHAQGWDRVLDQMLRRGAPAAELNLVHGQRGIAYLEVHRDPDAKDMLRAAVDARRFNESERVAAARAYQDLPRDVALGVFPGLKPFYDVADGARRTAERFPEDRRQAHVDAITSRLPARIERHYSPAPAPTFAREKFPERER